MEGGQLDRSHSPPQDLFLLLDLSSGGRDGPSPFLWGISDPGVRSLGWEGRLVPACPSFLFRNTCLLVLYLW